MLKINNLYVSFTKEFYTLNDINIQIEPGHRLVVVGNKESGRTALIRTLVGLETPAKGEIFIKNIPLNKIDFQNDISLAYLPAVPAFFENKTVKQNIEYVLNIRKEDARFIGIKTNNALISYGLEFIKNKKVKTLNYLDRIKLALARFSVRNIDLILVDDIFAKLSSEETKKIIKSIKDLIKSNNATALIMTETDVVANELGYPKKYLIYGSMHDEPNYELPQNDLKIN